MWHLKVSPDVCPCVQAVQGDLFDVAGAAADPATDMWALGAIAFEMFTAQGFFSRKSYTDNDVINMLLGFEPLPSESQPAFWHQIRNTAAQRLVQNLLRRVPEQRSTINEVLSLLIVLCCACIVPAWYLLPLSSLHCCYRPCIVAVTPALLLPPLH